MTRISLIACLFFSCISFMKAQLDLSYQMPPQVIADLADAPLTPAVSISPDQQYLLLLDRPAMPSIEEVSQEELRLGGIRINPQTNGSSRSSYYNGLQLQRIGEGNPVRVMGLPENARIENPRWSPDGKRVAFTNTTASGLEVWVLDIDQRSARRLTPANVNDATGGSPLRWFSDNRTLLYKAIPADRGDLPQPNTVPAGPVVQLSTGKAAAVRTYQDLLSNKHDEALFSYYTTSRLQTLDVVSGEVTPFAEAGIIRDFDPSPDGNYVMVTYVHRPFSYIVPYSRFPMRTVIFDRDGRLVREVADTPLAENVPKGFGAVPTGARGFQWRADVPASLYWVEAQDGGDPRAEADLRDRLYALDAPFTGQPRAALDFELRFGGVTWGDDDLAIAYEWWWTDRREVTSRWNPGEGSSSRQILFDRSWEDRYNDPGGFELTTNEYGNNVLLQSPDQRYLYLSGQGASPEGNRPFVDRFRLSNGKTERLWRSEAPWYEYPIDILDTEKGRLLTRRESREEPANYFIRDWDEKDGDLVQLTEFENPYGALKGIQKQLVRYERQDGVEMTGTLYLPAGYEAGKDEPLPVFMWAYPREYKSADAAGQVTDSPYEFIRLYGGSPLFWVTQGYAVFDDFAMPIIGEGEEEPNETFVEQLRMNARAAIDKLVDMEVADPDRIAVGGHSYGAFMTANLLAHTDLFAAGIARSGAYNRTLTPFGFQSEERTFWEAPEIYFSMSPFMHADQIGAPLLLIHGQADNNSGTFPMQSERFYAALKGHGATARLVMLPAESHGYRARESVMHMLWEMTQWLDTYVKNRQPAAEAEMEPAAQDERER